ncbi:MAG: S8 family serine peptidase [Planctomycetota bacterium]|jgi:hypothetical protein
MMILLISVLLFAPCLAQEETGLTSLEELPLRSYPLLIEFDEFVKSPAEQRVLAARLREDLLSDLESYDIVDPAVKREFYSRLLQLDLTLGRLDDALNDIQAMRRHSDSKALKLASALHAEAWVRARQTVGPDAESVKLRSAYAQRLRTILASLPRDAIHGEISRKRMKMQIASEGMLNMVISRTGSNLDGDGTIDGPSAHTLLSMCNALNFIVPLKKVTVEIYGEYLTGKEETARAPIMTERQVTLERMDRAQPVIIAVWDTGVDVDVFKGRLFVNPRERIDGKDTDGNGYVDDLNGIAFGMDLNPARGLLLPHGLDDETHAQVKKSFKGAEDAQTGFETPEAEAFKKLFATLSKNEWRELGRRIKLYDIYCHGTHVAGIASAGNPFARILTVRVGFDEDALKTGEWAHAFARMCRDSVTYFKANGVRVANLSWGWDVHEIEDNLVSHGAGQDSKERAAKIFGILEKGLREAIAGAPEILFVNGAGDAPDDPEEYRWIPGIFDLPNVVPVGAVNEFGQLTTFSAHGTNVRLLANGFHVNSFIPGGDRMQLSGTSMAAPQVTNLAAKLMALDPSLTPEEVIDLMIYGGEKVERNGRPHILLNPAESVKLLRDR